MLPDVITRALGIWHPHQGEEATTQSQQAPSESRSQIEEATAQLQRTSSEDQDSSPLSENPPNDRTNASGDDRKIAKHRQHERHSRPGSGTSGHRYPSEHSSSRGDPSHSRLRPQSAHPKRSETDFNQLADEHEVVKRNHRRLSETHRITIADLRETQSAYKRQEQEINLLKEKLRDTSALLETRNQELKVAKTFLSKEDPFSTSEVVQAVRDLNSEIMQTATYLADTLPLKRSRTSPVKEFPEGPYKTIFVSLVLPHGSEEVDAGSLELALQGFLTSYASRIANTWGFSRGSSWYDKLYSKVCETEDRAVANNWRVLTRRTLGHMDLTHENLPRGMVSGMVTQLADLLSSCGVGNSVENASNIQKYGAEKLEVLFTAARKLNRMIGENVVSEDLVVTVIHGDTMFDGERMEDAYARAGVKLVQRAVICTTDLGLCERRQTKGVGKMLLKPKVVLRDG